MSGRRAPGPEDNPDPEADPYDIAREIVLRRLTDRAHSRRELEQALAKRGTDPEVAAVVLDRLTEVGLVDDRAFAEAWVASRQERKHLSVRALRDELVKKGIDRDILDEVLQVVDADAEYDAALALAERKVRSMTGLAPEVRRRRLVAALARRGFSASVTSRVASAVDLDLDESSGFESSEGIDSAGFDADGGFGTRPGTGGSAGFGDDH
ncbi:regulatory protein RecX [Raineyella sp. LH-20]|uniref:regulatory protein RecX n=1 Tax=Raineyella sp. LH-20 TaxID=3081204 RepID=UPI0029535F54|nr:regulatory protein RecX [Raineyella sp. LH-20]WOP18300.1 regulatory protein RecX [Raineyella sp. LH-20]